MKEKLSYKAAFYPNNRHLEIRCIYSSLTFPFISKPVLGCLVGCNLFDRYEIFDKENILLTAQKYIPQRREPQDYLSRIGKGRQKSHFSTRKVAFTSWLRKQDEEQHTKAIYYGFHGIQQGGCL